MKKFNFEGGQKLSREEMKKVAGGFRDDGCQGGTTCVSDSDCPHGGGDYEIDCNGIKVIVHQRCYRDQGNACQTCHVAGCPEV